MRNESLPEGWTWIPIGDARVCTNIQPGFACGKKETVGGVPHLRMNNISSDGRADFTLIRRVPQAIVAKTNKWLESGDVLFCNTNSTELVGKTCVFTGWQEPCTFSNHLTRLRVNSNTVLPEWLFIALRHLWLLGFFATHCREFVGQSAYNQDKLRELPIPVPPLDDQRRIIARIGESTSRIQQAIAIQNDAFTEFSRCLPNIYFSQYERLCSEYDTIPLAKTGVVRGGGTPSKKKPQYWQGTIPWISPKVMKTFRINDSIEYITEDALDNCSANLIPSPAVLFVVRGMILIRNVPVAVSLRDVVINQDMKAIVPYEHIDAEFLASMILGAEELLLSKVEVAGHGTRKLETDKWGNLPIPLPKKEVQLEVVRQLNQLQEKTEEFRRLQEALVKELNSFIPALLAKAFGGEL